MNKFDHTTGNAPVGVSSGYVADPLAVVPLEAFATWTPEDMAAEVKRQSAEGPVCGYVCSATLEAIKQIHDLNPDPVAGADMLALDDSMEPGVIRYDHGERQRALDLQIVHYFAIEDGKQ
jgi:hypothetical protein